MMDMIQIRRLLCLSAILFILDFECAGPHFYTASMAEGRLRRLNVIIDARHHF